MNATDIGDAARLAAQPSQPSQPSQPAQPAHEVRVLTFQRAERAELRRRWPDEYTDTDEEYYPAAERGWREMAEQGVPAMRLVPGVVAELVAYAEQVGGAPTDTDVKTRYVGTVPDERTMPWPPQRNARCWCGSAVKYKKCCGRPD